MSQMLELPEPVHQGLIEAAQACGLEPADWIASRLSGAAAAVAVADDFRAARERLWSHVVSLGLPADDDNERIDADVARVYLDPHEGDDAVGDTRR